jgi:tetratricopeptide (TPR) repeat protein
MHNQNYSGAVKSFSIALDLHNWPPEIQADLLLHRASAQNEMSKPKLALQDLTRALKLNPNKSRGWYLLGKIVLQQGDASQAATVFERGLSANPTDAKCADALTKLQRELKRNSVTVKLDRIKELFNAKDYRQAISELTLGPLDIEPDNAQLLWMRSLLNLAAGDFELAESDVRKVPISIHSREMSLMMFCYCF